MWILFVKDLRRLFGEGRPGTGRGLRGRTQYLRLEVFRTLALRFHGKLLNHCCHCFNEQLWRLWFFLRSITYHGYRRCLNNRCLNSDTAFGNYCDIVVVVVTTAIIITALLVLPHILQIISLVDQTIIGYLRPSKRGLRHCSPRISPSFDLLGKLIECCLSLQVPQSQLLERFSGVSILIFWVVI